MYRSEMHTKVFMGEMIWCLRFPLRGAMKKIGVILINVEVGWWIHEVNYIILSLCIFQNFNNKCLFFKHKVLNGHSNSQGTILSEARGADRSRLIPEITTQADKCRIINSYEFVSKVQNLRIPVVHRVRKRNQINSQS